MQDTSPPSDARPMPGSSAGPVLLAGAIHLILVGLYLLPFGGDLSALVCASREAAGKGPFERIRVGFAKQGYDGQFYYVIAQNPFAVQSVDIDFPCYRHVRLLYPLTAWLLSGGDPAWLLWVMPLLNLTAIMGMTWLGAKFAIAHGRSPWWALLAPIATHSYACGLRNLTDPLANLAAVGLLVTWLLRWPTWLLLSWGIAAVLSREQNLAVVALILMETILDKDRRRSGAMVFCSLVWLAWTLLLVRIYHVIPFSSQNTGRPFDGLIHAWKSSFQESSGIKRWVHLLQIATLSAQLQVGTILLGRCSRTVGLLAIGGIGLALIGGIAIYEGAWSYLRVFPWAPLAIWLWMMESNRRWPALVLAPMMIWPILEVVKASQ